MVDSKSASYDWDSLIFTVQWPITTCLKWKKPAPEHTCILPENHRWTIHGVWPTKTGTEGPFFCNRTWPFDADQLAPLKEDLNRHWPNIHGGDTVDSLWRHEWDKHGTCAALHPSFASERLYFNQGLTWARKYHVSTILNDQQIHPTMTGLYNATRIWQVLRDSFGADPSIACDYDKTTRVTYLSEVRLCFRKDLTLIDCDLRHLKPMARSRVKSARRQASLTNCPVHTLIQYPGRVPPSSVPTSPGPPTQQGLLRGRPIQP